MVIHQHIKAILLIIVVLISAGIAGLYVNHDRIGHSVTSYLFATDATWPPMEFFTEDGELVGLDIDLLHMLAERSGVQLEIRSVPWNGIFTGLIQGHYDGIISSLTYTPEREKKMLLTVPYIQASQVFVVLQEKFYRDTNKSSTFASKEDLIQYLSHKPVGTEIATDASRLLENHPIILRDYHNIAFALEALLSEQLEAVLLDTLILPFFQKQIYEQRGEKLLALSPSWTDEQYVIAVRREQRDLYQKLNTSLQTLLQEGYMEELQHKWFG